MKETHKMGKWVKPENYRERRFNIVYKTTVEVGSEKYYYIGKHSTDVLEDGYLGSGVRFRRFLRDHPDSKIVREILSIHPTVEEALQEEERVVTLGMLRDPYCLNSIKGGGTFDTTGRVYSQEERERQSQRLKGHRVSEKQKQVISQLFKGRRSPTKGKVWVSLGEERHLVDPQEVFRWEEAGYVKGLPKVTGQKALEFHKNSVWVHLGQDSKLIRKEELDKYIGEGYKQGRAIGKGKRIWMRKDGEKSKMVRIEEIQMYQVQGWVEGRDF